MTLTPEQQKERRERGERQAKEIRQQAAEAFCAMQCARIAEANIRRAEPWA